MADNTMKPKIRFKGFNEDWEQRKLGDVGTAKSGIGFPDDEQGGSEGIPFFKVSDMNTEGNENELVIANNYVTEEQISRKRWNVIDDVPAIFFAKVGAAVMLNRKRLVRFPFLLDNNTMVYAFDKNIWDCDFGKTLFETIDLTKLTQIGALPSYNASDVKDVCVSIPERAEQKVIGKHFKQLDNLITLNQQKCDKLKNIKKSMLQKMFPQEGEKVPELRFAGFAGDWEQRKFSEFTEDVAVRNREGLDLECYAVTNDRGFISQKEAHDDYGYMNDADTSAYNIVPPKSFAYNPARINVGSIGYYAGTENVMVSSLYEVFQTADYIDDRFLWHWLKSDCFPRWIKTLQEGSVRLYFYYDKLIQCEMMIPLFDEQRKIGAYFDNLDNLINLYQQKCDKLKNIKKSLLQKMFV